MLGGGENLAVLSRRDGADDESSRRVAEGYGQEDHLVGGGRNHRGNGSDDAALAGATGAARLCWTGGPAQRKAQCAAYPTGEVLGPVGNGAISAAVSRS
jgi:hypothetical protein